jgi:small neutral amino acid transporter SnatA (MarC family)
MMTDLFKSTALMLVLLNPFLVIIYLVDLVEKLDRRSFARILFQGSFIATVVFCCFAILGDVIFSSIVQAEFASFQIFGGVIFFLIGLQFVFKGPTAIEVLRGDSKNLAGAIAMPVLIGPGTISASVVIGKRHEALVACGIIITAVIVSFAIMLVLKSLHDYVRPRSEPVVKRYIEIAGRITALYVGTVAVEMIMQGIRTWAGKF